PGLLQFGGERGDRHRRRGLYASESVGEKIHRRKSGLGNLPNLMAWPASVKGAEAATRETPQATRWDVQGRSRRRGGGGARRYGPSRPDRARGPRPRRRIAAAPRQRAAIQIRPPAGRTRTRAG